MSDAERRAKALAYASYAFGVMALVGIIGD